MNLTTAKTESLLSKVLNKLSIQNSDKKDKDFGSSFKSLVNVKSSENDKSLSNENDKSLSNSDDKQYTEQDSSSTDYSDNEIEIANYIETEHQNLLCEEQLIKEQEQDNSSLAFEQSIFTIIEPQLKQNIPEAEEYNIHYNNNDVKQEKSNNINNDSIPQNILDLSYINQPVKKENNINASDDKLLKTEHINLPDSERLEINTVEKEIIAKNQYNFLTKDTEYNKSNEVLNGFSTNTLNQNPILNQDTTKLLNNNNNKKPEFYQNNNVILSDTEPTVSINQSKVESNRTKLYPGQEFADLLLSSDLSETNINNNSNNFSYNINNNIQGVTLNNNDDRALEIVFNSQIDESFNNPVNQVTFSIKKGLESKINTISIQLHPENLGKLSVEIDLNGVQVKKIAFNSERQDTIYLLKEASKELQIELQKIIDIDSATLSFNLNSEGQNNSENNTSTMNKKLQNIESDLVGEGIIDESIMSSEKNSDNIVSIKV